MLEAEAEVAALFARIALEDAARAQRAGASVADPATEAVAGGVSAPLDVTQSALAGLGFAPGIGIGADLINGVLYAARGDLLGAGLSVLSAVPILGDAAGLARGGLVIGAAKGAADVGRAGKQARLRELANDDKLGSADRGWIKQELNSIDRGQRSSIRNPPGKDLAHERGREAAKGYDYSHSNLQDRDLHRLQHKYDDFGRANAERPLP